MERSALVNFRRARLQLSRGNDDKVWYFTFEAVQHENPKLSWRRLQLVPIQRKPTDAAQRLSQRGGFSRQEVFPVFHLKRNGAAVFTVGDQQVDTCILGWYPNVQLQSLLHVKADQVFPGVEREYWSHEIAV